uniref:Uncharacterized protein n=1 Tax=Solanum lycopersicum TaxID=4081 RepID=A0A494G8B5_SOLLC
MPCRTLFERVSHLKDINVMPRQTSSNHACCLKAMIACHVQLCVFSNGHGCMQRMTSSDRMCCSRSCVRSNLVYYPRAMMACHAKRCLTMCAIQGQIFHATPDNNRPCVCYKGDDCKTCHTSSDRVYCPRNMMTGHA